MTRQAIVAALCGMALGCGEESTAPPGALLGVWGAPGVELRADGREVTLRTTCDGWRGRGALVPGYQGRFVFALASMSSPPQSVVTLNAVVDGDVIDLQARFQYPFGDHSAQYQLTKDAPANLSGLCLVAGMASPRR